MGFFLTGGRRTWSITHEAKIQDEFFFTRYLSPQLLVLVLNLTKHYLIISMNSSPTPLPLIVGDVTSTDKSSTTEENNVESGGVNDDDNGEGQGYGSTTHANTNTTDTSVSLKSNTPSLTGDNNNNNNNNEDNDYKTTNESTTLLGLGQGQGQQQEDNERNYYDTTNDYRYLRTSNEENRRKCINGLAPVLLFLLLMGGLSFAMYQNFDRLYPGHGTYNDSSGSFANSARNHYDHKSYVIDENEKKNTDDNDSTAAAATTTTTTAQSNANNAIDNSNAGSDGDSGEFKVGVTKGNKTNHKSDSMPSDSDCSLHHKCDLLGLTGHCCPTTDGIKLSCCDDN